MAATRPPILDALVFRIAAPVLAVGLVVGAGLYLVLMNAVERFGTDQIAREVGDAAQDLYTICEENFDQLIRSGTLGDDRQVRIAQGRTLGEVEDLMRQSRLTGAVHVAGGPGMLAEVDLPGPLSQLEALVPAEHQMVFVDIQGERYGAFAFSFEPWNWRFIVLQDLGAFAGLHQSIRSFHLTVGAAGLLGVVFLFFLLGRFVREPLRAILDPLRRGEAPHYRGIREFEFLSTTIRRMMASERDKTVALANAQRIAHLGNWDWDIRQRTLTWSEELYRIVGVEPLPFEQLANAFWECIHPDDLARVRQAFREALKGGAPLDIEFRIRRPDGMERWVHARAEIQQGEPGRSVQMIGTAYDVTELKQATESLRATERRFRALAENSPAGIWQLDAEHRTVYANPAMCAMLGVAGLPALQGKTHHQFFSAEGLRAIDAEHQKRAGGVSSNYRIEVIRSDGTQRIAMVSGSPLMDPESSLLRGTIGTFIDVTEATRAESQRRRLEEQMQQTQRLESLGVLAGGIAHDFNNTLTPMIGYTEMVLEELPAASPLRGDLAHVLVAAERAGQLVDQILAFSRGDKEEAYPLQVTHIVKETLNLLRASFPATIDIQLDDAASDVAVAANPTHMHQIVTNLCTNASYAMAADGGVLEVILTKVEVGAPATDTDPRHMPGNYLRLAVRDTGGGIPAEVRERIFEPFFTTKGVGQGTGMGLSVVHGIVTRLGGFIEVQSEAGRGTTFEVFLPVVSGPAFSPSVETVVAPAGGSERVLLVDDEAAIADVWSQALERNGYQVFSTTSSAEALEVFEADPQRFDLVITDQTMPGLTGDKLAKRLLRCRPDLPIILCTGFSQTIGPERALEIGIRGFLMKPCRMDQIVDAVRRALGG